MPRCTFCGLTIEKGTGKMFVYTSGRVANFCSTKCEKNLLKLKRKPLKTKWTEVARKEKSVRKETAKVTKKKEAAKKQEGGEK